ncbi:MAG: hypothetical protein ABL890_02405 [Candidatus Peribacteraceae bacterium]
MSDPLDSQQSLTALRAAGALVLPREVTLRDAPHGKTWSGKKENGELWILTKKGTDLYECTC